MKITKEEILKDTPFSEEGFKIQKQIIDSLVELSKIDEDYTIDFIRMIKDYFYRNKQTS